ncbi:MAG TPA: glycosyltransferase [Anaerolineae bacterium]|nr:glycosyltransferase [Anaerolineae bacterium]
MSPRPGPAAAADSIGKRRILFLTPQLPYPPEQGTAIRNYNLIKEISRRHRVALLSFTDGGHPRDNVGPLHTLCDPLVTVPTPRRSIGDRLRILLTTCAPDMARRLYSPAFAAALRELVDAEEFDIIQVEGIELAAYALMIRGWVDRRGPAKHRGFDEGNGTDLTKPRSQDRRRHRRPALVFDDHNAEYLLQRRHFETDLGNPRRWPAALYSLIQWRRLRRFERQVCRQADAVLAVSEADAQALTRLLPGLEPAVIPNGVDLARHHPGLPDSLPLQHPAVLFTGKMDYRPNVDAMLWFHESVWPLIRAHLPQAHLYVVGKQPHPRLASLGQESGVTITGYVADILPYFGGADVYVVPLRVGGGTRLKVLEAMSAGLPLVSTTLGVEGVGLTPGQHALLSDTPQGFAHAVLALLRDPEHGRALGMAARRLVVNRYGWGHIVARLEPLYASL